MKWKQKKFSLKGTLLSLLGGALLIALGLWLAPPSRLACLASSVSPYQRFEAEPSAGVHWPWYVFVSPGAAAAAERGEVVPLLVMPNNTGRVSDDLAVHEQAVLKSLDNIHESSLVNRLNAVVLMPVFPRPASEGLLYTHALDRDALALPGGDLARLDLQLDGMITMTVGRLALKQRIVVQPRVLMFGFSAAGMFVNRFVVLHPERVLAAAVGSPGGWPIAPVPEWRGETLRYPVGIADIADLTGSEPDLTALRDVPLLLFIGAEDDNDSVPYDDSYDEPDRRLVNALFGETPTARWPSATEVYYAQGMNAEFKTYPGVGHDPVPAFSDVLAFFDNALRAARRTGD